MMIVSDNARVLNPKPFLDLTEAFRLTAESNGSLWSSAYDKRQERGTHSNWGNQ